MPYRLTKEFRFEAAHHLPKVPDDHPCRRLHGHSYRVEISVEGEIDPALGWVCDYGTLSQSMAPLLKELDHHCLNDLPGLENPTSEILAAWLWTRLETALPGLCEITVQETVTARCSYRK